MTNPATTVTTVSTSTMPWVELRPFFSVVVLQYTASDPAFALQQLLHGLRPADGPRRGRPATILVEGHELRTGIEKGSPIFANAEIDELYAIIRKVDEAPSWLAASTTMIDTRHHLTVLLRRGNLVAVCTEDSLQNRLQRWLDKPPRPNFRKIPTAHLER
jgi:hypothetical protein